MSNRTLKLFVFDDPADIESRDNIYVAAHPVRPDPYPVPTTGGGTYWWDADDPEKVGEFFKQYIIENWEGIARGTVNA